MIRKIVRILAVLSALTLFAGAAFAQGTDASAKKPKKAPKAALVDVNAASADDLAKLPGIDAATAGKIVAGRPYNTKRDLLTKKIVTQDGYDKIKDLIVAHKVASAKPKKGSTPAPK